MDPSPLFAEVIPDSLFGLPAHPLLVHLPVMLVPLAAIGALFALLRPSWRSWLLPLTATFGGVALVGVQLAMWSGENLERQQGESAIIERHSHLADQSRPFVAVFFLLSLAAAIYAWRSARVSVSAESTESAGSQSMAPEKSAGAIVALLCVLSLLTGVLSTVWIARTGHVGAKSVWQEKSDGDKKGEKAKPGGDD